MPRYRKTEVTLSKVTTIVELDALDQEQAEILFDDGEWDTRSFEEGDIVTEISSFVEQVEEQP